MRRLQVLVICLLVNLSLFAQKPEIVSISKTNGPNGTTITINGNDFGTEPENLRVFFGGAYGNIKNSGNQIIEAQIPPGATHDYIGVTNISSKLTTSSKEKFFINYGGEHGLELAKFSSQTDFSAESGLYDLCLCDFNKDGKLDIATVGEKANTISISTNNSSPSTLSLAKTSVTVNTETLHITCGDLNGDGNADIVATENEGDRLFILRNNGNNTFTSTPLKLSGNKLKRVAIADLDLNGKPDLIVTDQLSNTVTILSNQSTSSIAFAAPVKVTLPGIASSDALDIEDFNGDGLPEIITSSFFTSQNNKILILINNSSPGEFNFEDNLSINTNNTVVSIKAGDLDGDEKPDFAVTRILNAEIQVFRNTGVSGELAFANPVSFATSVRPWGLDFGDFDGDGKLDIAVAAIQQKELSIFNNESTSGTIAFAEALQIPTTYINKHIKIGDLNTDGKPDIAFTSIDDETGVPILSSKISIITNKACLVPQVSPEGPLVICDGLEFELTASPSNGTLYQWKKDGANYGGSSTVNTLDVTEQGLYTVTATTQGCEKTSNQVNIGTAVPGAGLNGNDPAPGNDGPVCSGGTVTLTVNDVDATSYRWKGPNDFTQTTTGLSITRSNFQLEDAGIYIVEMLSGDCVSKIDTTLVEGIYIPEFTLNYSGSEEICEGLTKNISSSPLATSGFSFQWFEQTLGAIAGATNGTYEVSASGEYYLQIEATNGNCGPVNTDQVTINTVEPPQAAFTLPEKACVDVQVEIVNQSITDPNAEAIFNWDLGEGSPVVGETPELTYSTTGTKTVTLSITYDGVTGCSHELSRDLEVVAGLQPEINDSIQNLCVDDTLTLSIEGTFASVLWNTNATTNSIDITSAGDYSVITTDPNGCEGEDIITIGSLPKPVLTVTASETIISLGQIVDLSADIADPLDNNATFAWSPKETLDDSTKQNPIAKPTENTVYTVVGTTEDGCSASESVAIEVASIGAGIKAAALFSPNNDTDNDTWVILGIENYPLCTITVYDANGRKVYEKKGYTNDWNGEYNGNALPVGVYYYVFSCADQPSSSGTVTLIR